MSVVTLHRRFCTPLLVKVSRVVVFGGLVAVWILQLLYFQSV